MKFAKLFLLGLLSISSISYCPVRGTPVPESPRKSPVPVQVLRPVPVRAVNTAILTALGIIAIVRALK